jgi:hypothetical protein
LQAHWLNQFLDGKKLAAFNLAFQAFDLEGFIGILAIWQFCQSGTFEPVHEI